MRRLVAWLASPRLAAWLIATLIAMSVVNVLLPQRTYMGSEVLQDFARAYPALAVAAGASGLDDVFGGWMLICVAVLLFLNVATCTLRRLRGRERTPRLAVGAAAERVPLRGDATAMLDHAADALGDTGWDVTRFDEGLVAKKGRLGFAGSILMHVSLLVIIVGGAVTAVTSFSGTMLLAEGQRVRDEREAYLSVSKVPMFGNAFTGAVVGLDSMDVEYESGVVVKADARMSASQRDGAVFARIVRVNRPFDVEWKSYLVQDSGYAAALLVKSADGAQTSIVNLSRDIEQGLPDSIELSGGGSGRPLVAELGAVPAPPEGKRPAGRLDIVDPRLTVRLFHGDETGTTLARATLKRGEGVEADGIALTFEDLRLWNMYVVRGAPGRW